MKHVAAGILWCVVATLLLAGCAANVAIEGRIKEVTEAIVSLEIDGQPISFPRNKVRSVYFEPATIPSLASPMEKVPQPSCPPGGRWDGVGCTFYGK